MFGSRPFGTRGFGDNTGDTTGRTSVAATLALLWAVRQAVTDTADLRWHTRAAAADTLDLLWNTKAAVSDDLALLWNTRAQVAPTLDLRWQVLERVFGADRGKELELVWRVYKNLEDVDRLPYYKIGPRHARIIVRGNQ